MAEGRPPARAGLDPQYRQAAALEELVDIMMRTNELLASVANSLLEVAMVLQSGKVVGIKVEPGPTTIHRDLPTSEMHPPTGGGGKRTAGPG